MKIRLLYIVGLLLVSVPAMSAVLHFNIQGVISDQRIVVEEDGYGSLPQQDDPYPNLFGGSFAGTFSIDDNRPPVLDNQNLTRYEISSVDIDVFDSGGSFIHTISKSDHSDPTIAIFKVDSGTNFSAGDVRFHVSNFTAYEPDGLDLVFAGPLISSARMLSIEEVLAMTLKEGGIYTYHNDLFLWWGKEVATTTITFAGSTASPPVPVPSTIWLFISSLSILVINRRFFFAKIVTH